MRSLRFQNKMYTTRVEGLAAEVPTNLQSLKKTVWQLAVPLLTAVLLFIGWKHYTATSVKITLWLDGRPVAARTHAKTVGAFLEQQGLRLAPEDVVWPALDSPLTPGAEVRVDLARPVLVRVDGRTLSIRTQAATPEEVLKEAGIHMGPQDVLLLNGEPVDHSASAFVSEQRALASRGAGRPVETAPVHTLEIRRAVPVTVNEDGVQTVLYSTASTVGEALVRAGLQIYLGDSVLPDAGTPLLPGMQVFVRRAVPIVIEVDSRIIRTRTRGATVAEALAQEGIALVGMDYSEPSPDTPISENMEIRVVRQHREFLIEQEPIPYDIVWKPDPLMEIDQRRVQISGEPGLRKRRISVLVRDGVEVERKVLDEWVALEPQAQVIAYGTKIVVREVETPDGTIRYWRKIRMLATSYTAATSGKTRDHPAYGITRVGWVARKGIVAVDPNVINLRTRVYVPGYGFGDVGDTGGAIKGRRIDLCYDEDNLKLWYNWVDVYLLAPPPPADEIRYVLPDWPVEKRR